MTYSITFDEDCDLRALPGPKRIFELLSPFCFTVDDGRNTVVHTVPQGFITDLASIPDLAQGFDQNDAPDILRPSVAHDWLYQHQGYVYTHSNYTRAECDAILREGMAACGGDWLRRWTVWVAVRAFGEVAWSEAAVRKLTLHIQASEAKTTP